MEPLSVETQLGLQTEIKGAVDKSAIFKQDMQTFCVNMGDLSLGTYLIMSIVEQNSVSRVLIRKKMSFFF